MNCGEVRGLLSAYMDNELDTEARRNIDLHMNRCTPCAAALAQLESVRDRVRSDAPYYTAPEGLRDRVQSALHGLERLERAPSARTTHTISWKPWAALAASITLAAAISVPLLVRRGIERRLVGEELMAAHARALMGHEIDIVSTDQHTVKPWFNGRLPFSPPVANLAAEGFPLEGGRLDYAGGRTVAVLVYRRALHRIDVFVWPETESPALQALDRDGFHEISWQKDNFTFSAVSDVNPAELRRLEDLLKSR